MLELLHDLPDQVVAVTATGEVTGEDYKSVLIPAVEERLAKHRRLRLLYVLGSGFSGFTGAAAWEDTKIGMRHFTDFERIAVVTDTEWVRNMVKAMGFVLPGDVRTYAEDSLDDAKSWVSAPSPRGQLAFELLQDQRVLVLEPRDELVASDFERVADEVDPFIDQVGGLAGLVVVAEEFPGWDDFAALTAHFRFVREHHDKIRRVALVTGSQFLSALPRLAGLFVAAEVRRFAMQDRAAAMDWASGG